jgi:hypothetical protein
VFVVWPSTSPMGNFLNQVCNFVTHSTMVHAAVPGVPAILYVCVSLFCSAIWCLSIESLHFSDDLCFFRFWRFDIV